MTTWRARRPFSCMSTGMPRPSSDTRIPFPSVMVTVMVSQWPARASSMELSTTSYTKWCSPRTPTSPMYIDGRIRTCSSPPGPGSDSRRTLFAQLSCSLLTSLKIPPVKVGWKPPSGPGRFRHEKPRFFHENRGFHRIVNSSSEGVMHPCQDPKSLYKPPHWRMGYWPQLAAVKLTEAVVVGVVSGDIEVEETRQAKLILPVTKGGVVHCACVML